MIVDTVRVKQIEALIDELRENIAASEKIGLSAEPARAILSQIENALEVDFDMEVGRATAKRGTGLSYASLRKRPKSGAGKSATWTLRDLMSTNPEDQGATEDEDLERASCSESDWLEAAAEQAALDVAV